jgi:hypothetical protein
MSFIRSGGTCVGGPPLIGTLGWVLPGGFTIDMDFANGRYFGNAGVSALTVSRASSATDLLPTSNSGTHYTTFANNVARVTAGSGLLVEEQRINELVNSDNPATQTINLSATGTYTLWINGSGSATSSANSATITGGGAASHGAPNVFVVTVAGTVDITVAGTVFAFQCEKNPGTVSAPTSLIVSGASRTTRAADVVTLTTPPVFGSAYTLFAAGAPNAPTTYATSQNLIQSDIGNDTQRVLIRRVSATGSILVSKVGGTGGAFSPTGTWSQGVLGKVAAAVAPGAQSSVFNGGSPGTSAGATLPTTPTALHLGVNASVGDFFDGIISRIAIAPTVALPAALLQQITNLAFYN